MTKTMYIDVMVDDTYYGQLKYIYEGVEPTKEEINTFILDKMPLLKHKKHWAWEKGNRISNN